jgi:GNAT superfamily N-acetyltransferase
MNAEEIAIEELHAFSPEIGDVIRHLVAQLDNNYQSLSDEDVQGIINAENTHLFVAKLASHPEKIVGMFTLIVYRIPYKKKAWIEDVVVDLEFRRQGIAKKMLSQAIEEARKRDIKSLNLTSSPSRGYANQIYVQLGFEKRDTNVYRINF